MSVKKIYEFTCDYYGCAINHLLFIPKTKKEYEECGGELIDLLFNLCIKIKEQEQHVG